MSRVAHGLHWAVADPWEVRGAGRTPCRARSERLAIVKLIRREKPTAVACETKRLRTSVHQVAKVNGVATVDEPPPVLEAELARDLYPEAAIRAPTDALLRLASVAISAVLHADIPTRRYARNRDRAVPRAA